MKNSQARSRALVAGDAPGIWRVYSVLVGLLLIRFLPLVAGTTWLWGVAQLTLLPGTYVIGFGLLSAFILALPLHSKAQNWGNDLAGRFTTAFFTHPLRYVHRGVIVLAAGIAFTFLPMPTHFLGDGQTYLANMVSESGHWVKWSESGAITAIMGLMSLLGAPSEHTGLMAFRIISVVSGVATTWLYFLLAQRISQEPVKRTLSFFVLFFSSTLLLYFGYAESYPIMWAPAVGFLYFSYTYSTEGRGAVPALAFLLIAGFLHLQVGMFVPAFVFLLLSRGSGRRLYVNFRTAFKVILGLTVLAAGGLGVYEFMSNLAFQNIFLFLISGKPAYPGYAAFSLRHVADMLNVFLLVYPVGLVVLTLSWTEVHRRLYDSTVIYLGLLSTGSFLFLLLVDPGLSMPRDWDLFSLCCIAPMILFLHVMPEIRTGSVRRLALPIVSASALCVLPWLMVNLHRERSVAEIKQIIDNNHDKSFGTLSLLRSWYQSEGDTARADSVGHLRQTRYPRFFAVRQAWTDLQAGNMELAENEFRSISPDIYSPGYYRFLSDLALRKHQLDSALYYAEQMVKLAPNLDESYVALSTVYMAQKRPESAVAALRRGYALNSKSVPLLMGLAAHFASTGRYDSALVYSSRALELNPRATRAYFIAAWACKQLALPEQAHDYAVRYLETTQNLSGVEQDVQQLLTAFPDLRDSIQAGQRATEVGKPENSPASDHIN